SGSTDAVPPAGRSYEPWPGASTPSFGQKWSSSPAGSGPNGRSSAESSTAHGQKILVVQSRQVDAHDSLAGKAGLRRDALRREVLWLIRNSPLDAASSSRHQPLTSAAAAVAMPRFRNAGATP